MTFSPKLCSSSILVMIESSIQVRFDPTTSQHLTRTDFVTAFVCPMGWNISPFKKSTGSETRGDQNFSTNGIAMHFGCPPAFKIRLGLTRLHAESALDCHNIRETEARSTSERSSNVTGLFENGRLYLTSTDARCGYGNDSPKFFS